jgi:hypothetical protein
MSRLSQDPYDITGAHKVYNNLVASGEEPAEALLKAEMFASVVPFEHVTSGTQSVNTYLSWCRSRGVDPVDFDTLAVFSSEKSKRGRPYPTSLLCADDWRVVRAALNAPSTVTASPSPSSQASTDEHSLPPDVYQMLLESQFRSATSGSGFGYKRTSATVRAVPLVMLAFILMVFFAFALLGSARDGTPTSAASTSPGLTCQLVSPGNQREFYGPSPDAAVLALASHIPNSRVAPSATGWDIFQGSEPYGNVVVREAREQSTIEEPFKGNIPRWGATLFTICADKLASK